MHLRICSDCDPSTWDTFVGSHVHGNCLQSHAWGSLNRKMGWDTHFCILEGGSEIHGAALLLSRSIPGLGRVFHAPRGPVVDFEDPSVTRVLTSELARYVASQAGVFVRFDPYRAESLDDGGEFSLDGTEPVPRDWSPWNAPRFVFWLSLEGTENDVMMRMESRCRNDVRRGYRNGVDFELGTEDDVDAFFRLMTLTGQQKGIAFHGVDYYRTLLSTLTGAARAQLFVGRFEGEPVTVGVSVVYGDKAWLLYAASDPSSYKLRANRTQQWEMIKWAHEQGCVRYDFRGTATNDPPRKEDPGYGVYKFKKSFGPEFTRLVGYYDLVQRPLRYRLLRVAEDYGLPAAYRLKTILQR